MKREEEKRGQSWTQGSCKNNEKNNRTRDRFKS